MSARAASRSGGAAILWGLFAASSWAWCIGLFLPVVLRRLMGWPGFAAFAIPNIVGCAAFGFVLDRRRSRRLVREHRGAMVAFGAVTIAYQLLLAGWTGRVALAEALTPALGDASGWAGAGLGMLAVVLVGLAVAATRDRVIAWIAVGAWVFSAIVLVSAWRFRPPVELDPAAFAPELASNEVWWLLPSLVLGFLLCPYLDLTFHRALRRGPRRATFAIFGVSFGTLIVLVALLADPAALESTGIGMTLVPLLLAQLWVQLGFTSGAHAREIARTLERRRGGPATAALTIAAAGLVGILLGTPLLADEANYLRMLGWYGLVFPAYVMVAMVARGRSPDSSVWWLVGGAALVGLPMMEVGISGRAFVWTAGGAAAVVAATVVAIALPRRSSLRTG